MDSTGLNKLCIDVDDIINFDVVMRKTAEKIGLSHEEDERMEKKLCRAWIDGDDFEFDFIYDTDYAKFECRITFTGSCVFVESDTKYACITITEIVESIMRGEERDEK